MKNLTTELTRISKLKKTNDYFFHFGLTKQNQVTTPPTKMFMHTILLLNVGSIILDNASRQISF
jgi:hypothetical protein